MKKTLKKTPKKTPRNNSVISDTQMESTPFGHVKNDIKNTPKNNIVSTLTITSFKRQHHLSVNII